MRKEVRLLPKLVTPEDRICIRFIKDRGKILEFAVQYDTFVSDEWKEVSRVDNCHPEGPHRHVFYRDGSEREPTILLDGDAGDLLTEWNTRFSRDYAKFKDSFMHS